MQRLPTQAELNGLVEAEIREQVLYREALAMGLAFVVVFALRRPTGLRLRRSAVRAAGLLRDSWPLIVTGLSATVYMKIDRIMLGQMLGDQGVKATVTGRPKHIYSIYRKMMEGGRSFEEIHDLIGIRIVTEEVADCYAALGMVHTRWPPVHGRFKDYIAMPKFNFYQSLETLTEGLGRGLWHQGEEAANGGQLQPQGPLQTGDELIGLLFGQFHGRSIPPGV